ncbi:hypothetical protein [Phenylobacterium sp. J367]|uniref:hypothetical protein n=1 Tax=Phenylobacterium sp. J367 TaxID=2898435 RepID=UPI0021511001|nr:hypothetical protein [Phenylobacterium sp. J367]MCR5879124.1 hypothetical protein [Phenylobacterium sp. J367]
MALPLPLRLLAVAALLLSGCEDAAPPIRHGFKTFTLEVPERGGCRPSGVEGDGVRLKLRPPDPAWLAQTGSKLAVPPFADRPCPAPEMALDVRLHGLDGGSPAIGPGNLLSDAPDGPPLALPALPLSRREMAVLRPFFGTRTPRPLAGRSPPALYACDPEDCRVAFGHGSAIVTVRWERTATDGPPYAIVSYVADHLIAWSRREPCEDVADCEVRVRWAYETGRAAAQAAFARGDVRGVTVVSMDPEGGSHDIAPGFLCLSPPPTTLRPMGAGEPQLSPQERNDWALGFNDRIWQLGGGLKRAGCRPSPRRRDAANAAAGAAARPRLVGKTTFFETYR